MFFLYTVVLTLSYCHVIRHLAIGQPTSVTASYDIIRIHANILTRGGLSLSYPHIKFEPLKLFFSLAGHTLFYIQGAHKFAAVTCDLLQVSM